MTDKKITIAGGVKGIVRDLLNGIWAPIQGSVLFGRRESDGALLQAHIDPVAGSLMTITHQHHQIHEGSTFRYCDAVTLNAAATQDYLITVPDSAELPHFTWSVDGTAVTTLEIFKDCTHTGTTLQTVFNADHNSSAVAGVTVHKGATGGADGTSFCKYSSGSAQGAANDSANADYSKETIFKRNSKYLIRITSGTAGNLCNLNLDWYEHTAIDSN